MNKNYRIEVYLDPSEAPELNRTQGLMVHGEFHLTESVAFEEFMKRLRVAAELVWGNNPKPPDGDAA